MPRPEPPEKTLDSPLTLAELVLTSAAEVYLRPLPRDLVVVWAPGGPAALCTRAAWRGALAEAAARGGAT